MKKERQKQKYDDSLSKASFSVAALYSMEYPPPLAIPISLLLRDDLWGVVERRFPDLQKEIVELGEGLKGASVTRKNSPPAGVSLIRMNFVEVPNEAVRELLTDIVFSRASRYPGVIDYDVDMLDETEAVIQELGFTNGLSDPELRNLKLKDVFSAVLSKKLRFRNEKRQ